MKSRWLAASVIMLASAGALLGGFNGTRAQEVPPPNDDFAAARRVGLSFSPPGGGYEDTVSTAGATREQGEPPCVTGGTVWYIFYPPASGEYMVDTSGSDFATMVCVYHITNFAPSPPGASLEEISASGNPTGPAVVTFPARTSAGGYAIQIGGWDGASGNLHVRIHCEPECAPYNDDIGSAMLYYLPFTEQVSTLSATMQRGETSPCGQIGKTVWYRIDTFEEAGDVIHVDAVGDGYQAVVALYELDTIAAPSPPGGLQLIACDDGAAGTASGNLTFVARPSTHYYVQIGGRDGAGGLLSVSVTCDAGVCELGVIAIETGGGSGQDGTARGGELAPPDTGTGGYLDPDYHRSVR